MQTISDLGGKTIEILRTVGKSGKYEYSAFNPGMTRRADGSIYLTIRSSNYILRPNGIYLIKGGTDFRSKIFTAVLTNNYEVKDLQTVEYGDNDLRRGIEDVRTYLGKDGKLQHVGNVLEYWIPKARMCSFDIEGSTVVNLSIHDSPTDSKVEKNWTPVDGEGADFDFMYRPNVVMRGGKLIELGPIEKKHETLRGGTQLIPYGDRWICVMHKTLVETRGTERGRNSFTFIPEMIRSYFHYFVVVDKNGTITAVSSPFVFDSIGIEFASGIVDNGKEFLVTYGVNDAVAKLAVIPRDVVDGLIGSALQYR